MGCKSLIESVIENANPIGSARETRNSRMKQKTIMDRARLFYYEYSKDKIKRDIEWLEKLKVREVKQIDATYTLPNYETQRISIPTCIKNESNDSWILYVTSESGFRDISQHLVRNIYNSNRRKDVIHLKTLLSTSLLDLAEDYPIDCIPNLPNLQHTVEDMFNSSVDCVPIDEYMSNLPGVDCVPSDEYIPNLHAPSVEYIRNSPVDSVHSVYIRNSPVDSVHSVEHIRNSPVNRTAIATISHKNLLNALRDALNACRSNSGSVINSQISIHTVPSHYTIIPGKSNICLIYLNLIIFNFFSYLYLITLGRSSYNVGTLQGIKIYIPTNAFNNTPLERFVNKLKNLVEVFQLSSEVIHVSYDENTSSICFQFRFLP